jgi:DNA repair exonuclease SbcCD ATPase subunit
LTKEKIDLQLQNIEDHKKLNDEEIAKKQTEIETSKQQITNITESVKLISKHVDILVSKVGDKKEKLEKKSKSLLQIKGKIETNIDRNQKDIDFYEDNHDCPTCKQAITTEWKQSQVNEKTQKIDSQKKGLEEVENELKKITGELKSISDVVKHINEHNNEITKHNATILAINGYITKLNQEITELSNKKLSSQDGNSKLRDLKTDLHILNESYEELIDLKHYHEFASTLLKDTGIKTKIIKQYLPIMNKLINKYLTAMDFFVNFNIDENFNETIKSRHRDEFSYANFSEGEKMRIDLALLFTWRQIAKLKNSTNTNLLILDEVFDSSLDTVGTEEFLKLIHEMGSDTNIFVISHKGDQLFDKFRSVLKFEKKGNFSRISK